jgi:hypothetical protein
MKFWTIISFMFVLIIAPIGKCGQDDEAINLLRKQIETANNRDLNGYMSTIDSSNPYYSQIKEMIKELFTNFKFKMILEKTKVLKSKVGFVVVRATVITKFISGPVKGQNNRVTTDNEIKLVSGKWKLTNGKLVKMEVL